MNSTTETEPDIAPIEAATDAVVQDTKTTEAANP